ncbi:hypothetical protein JZ751_017598 [Albula glossodonta]|uniref:Uncharacterized protein n=1 Tax=Albula glossodonta TaxID=121402 RepID=A0A8T2PNM4_9TELE|nr:hypothetical protein JZ751_017598 [Albula glossodonta]
MGLKVEMWGWGGGGRQFGHTLKAMAPSLVLLHNVILGGSRSAGKRIASHSTAGFWTRLPNSSCTAKARGRESTQASTWSSSQVRAIPCSRADCSQMMPIKALAVPEQYLGHRETAGRVGDGEEEREDRYSLTSVSPAPGESLQWTGPSPADKAGEDFTLPSLLLVSPHPEDGLGSVGPHVPLESIREQDEADEPGSEPRRSPGDGAVRVREGVADNGSLSSSAERSSGVGDGSGDGNAPSGAGLVPTFRVAVARDQRAKLDSEMADLLKHPPGASEDDLLQVESLNIPSEGKCEGSGFCSGSSDHHEAEECCSSTEISKPQQGVQLEGSLGNDLGTSVTSLQELQDLQDLKLKHQLHQTEVDRLCTALRDSKERIGELEGELSSERKKGESQAHKIQELETEKSNTSLIAVLTECQSKVEQLEELKHSSVELMGQLRAAQGMAACLQRRMCCLEKEHIVKQREVLQLTEELEEARKALQEKSRDMARVTAQLQVLEQERTGENGTLTNGHVNLQPHQQPGQYPNDSKVCTLL